MAESSSSSSLFFLPPFVLGISVCLFSRDDAASCTGALSFYSAAV